MQNRWNDQDAALHTTDLALRVYSSRLLGQDSSLVLHGGGNTSVKVTETNLVGEEEEILYVKGSGWDLETIEETGFAPVRMAHLLKLAQLKSLTDPQMVNELKTNMTLASAPSPSVETILHASLPYKYVDHTHADAVVTITNSRNGLARIQEIYGEDMVIIPYVMPGFDLAKLCAERFTAEATNIDRFLTNFKDYPSLVIPEVYWDCTAQTILVMQRIKGRKLNELDEEYLAGFDKAITAENGTKAFLKQIFEDNFFHFVFGCNILIGLSSHFVRATLFTAETQRAQRNNREKQKTI